MINISKARVETMHDIAKDLVQEHDISYPITDPMAAQKILTNISEKVLGNNSWAPSEEECMGQTVDQIFLTFANRMLMELYDGRMQENMRQDAYVLSLLLLFPKHFFEPLVDGHLLQGMISIYPDYKELQKICNVPFDTIYDRCQLDHKLQ